MLHTFTFNFSCFTFKLYDFGKLHQVLFSEFIYASKFLPNPINTQAIKKLWFRGHAGGNYGADYETSRMQTSSGNLLKSSLLSTAPVTVP